MIAVIHKIEFVSSPVGGSLAGERSVFAGKPGSREAGNK
jgi:hypothetical protein